MPRSWFHLTLDTTPPDLEVALPPYVLQQEITPIFIHSTEELGTVVQLYTIDKDDVRRDYIFQHQGDKLFGLIDFNSYPLGFVSLYAQAMDVVNNVSPLRSATANVVKAAELHISITMQVRNMAYEFAARSMTESNVARLPMTGVGVRNMESDQTVRVVSI